jgi:uncharacterized protein (TIGR02271 family)
VHGANREIQSKTQVQIQGTGVIRMATSIYGDLVVASFDKHSDAENALRDLQIAGFRSNQIGSSFEDYDADDYGSATSPAYGNAASTTAGADHRSFWEKMKDFFSGEEHDETNSVYGKDESGWARDGYSVPQQYRSVLDTGGELITVSAGDRKDEAERILTRNNGQIDRNFSENLGQSPTAGSPQTSSVRGSSAVTDTASNMTTDRTGEILTGSGSGETPERRIQLISEVLRVRKERVSRGEVRLRKEVRTDTQTVQVPVTREEIVIERNTVSGERPASGTIGTESEIRVPLSEERVQVEKVPVVREEVTVGKRPVSETRNVSEQVRREELDVEGADEKATDASKKRKTA